MVGSGGAAVVRVVLRRIFSIQSLIFLKDTINLNLRNQPGFFVFKLISSPVCLNGSNIMNLILYFKSLSYTWNDSTVTFYRYIRGMD